MAASSISEFYAGRSIFVTGFSGFMGKVLVEKLLFSCPNIGHIYVLIRPKKGQEPKQRIENILASKIFERLQQNYPDFKEKIIPVCGDMLEPQLGMSESDHNKLTSEVSVVFHSAATVKFNEILRVSVQMNIVGVKKLLALAHQMTKLEAFIHVSTAYANCDKSEILETVYEPPLHPQKILDAIEWMDDDIFEELTPKMLGERPNTYTYTKALAEYLLVQEGTDLPIAIVRPSIVGASWKEPFPGWVDNFNGPSGLLAAIGKGLLRIMLGNSNATADIIPVDSAVNFMIASAWYTATETPQIPLVYNCTTGQTNKFTWGQLERNSFEYFMKHPVDNITRIPNPRFTRNNLWYHLNVWFDHQLPAYIIDLYLTLTGKKAIFVRLNNRLFKSVKSLEFFTSHEWKFHNDNFQMVLSKLSREDRQVFDFDVRTLNWAEYMENYCLGTKQYVLKEELSGLPAARKTLKRLQTMHKVFNAVMFIAIWRFLTTRVGVVRKLWLFVLSFALKLLKLMSKFVKS